MNYKNSNNVVGVFVISCTDEDCMSLRDSVNERCLNDSHYDMIKTTVLYTCFFIYT